MKQKYSIEQRSGCIAIIDNDNYKFDHKGIDGEKEGVVKFAMGKIIKGGGGHEWILGSDIISKFEMECERLNEQHSASIEVGLS